MIKYFSPLHLFTPTLTLLVFHKLLSFIIESKKSLFHIVWKLGGFTLFTQIFFYKCIHCPSSNGSLLKNIDRKIEISSVRSVKLITNFQWNFWRTKNLQNFFEAFFGEKGGEVRVALRWGRLRLPQERLSTALWKRLRSFPSRDFPPSPPLGREKEIFVFLQRTVCGKS